MPRPRSDIRPRVLAAARERFLARRRLDDRPAASLEELVGQERAVEALGIGLGTEAPGFHLFVCGPRGSGRSALVRAALLRFQQSLGHLARGCRVVLENEIPDRLIAEIGIVYRIEMVIGHGMRGRGK